MLSAGRIAKEQISPASTAPAVNRRTTFSFITAHRKHQIQEQQPVAPGRRKKNRLIVQDSKKR
jgi:hypothetical protein